MEPEREVPGISFVRVFLESGAGLELLERIAGKLSIIGKRRYVVEDVAVHFVGMSSGDERLDHPDHERDMRRGTREELCRDDIERVLVMVKRVLIESCDLLGRLLFDGCGWCVHRKRLAGDLHVVERSGDR